MFQITDVILISLFIEAVVNAIKPIWSSEAEGFSVSDYVSMAMGVLLAVTCKINMLAYVVDIAYPAWVEYIFYTLTGVAIGRGTNFLYDLWNKIKEWQAGQTLPAAQNALDSARAIEEDIDLEVAHWPLEQLMKFAKVNRYVIPDALPADEKKAKAMLIDCLFGPEEDDA